MFTYKVNTPINSFTNYIHRLLGTSVETQSNEYSIKCATSIACNLPNDIAMIGAVERHINSSRINRMLKIGFYSALATTLPNFTSTMDMILQMVLTTFVDPDYWSYENDDNED